MHPSGLLTGHTIAGYDPRVVERLARVADAVHSGGGRMFVQLFHGGREQIDLPPRAPAVAPSAIPSQRFKVEPRALSAHEIEEIVAHHELVAGHARAAGLDGVELCASHGYLPTQFLSERSNRRDDAWGGDAERRLHYVREALRAMRRGAGDGLAVGHPAVRRRDAARGPPRTGDRGHPAHALAGGPDRLRERRDRRLGELPRLGLDRAAAADRARCDARAGGHPARARSRCR